MANSVLQLIFYSFRFYT